MGATPGKPSYSVPGLVFGQLLRGLTYTRPLRFAPVEGDLAGKTFVVTGGSSGIGLEVARGLLRMRAGSVHLLCRDLERGKQAAEALRKEATGSTVSVHAVDVGVARDVRSFVELLGPVPVHGLVNNAGALVNRRVTNADGLESHVGAHVVGLHAMTRALAPRLAEGACVVNVASAGLYTAALDVLALEEGFKGLARPIGEGPPLLDGALAYAVCKRAQLELTQLWAQELPEQRVLAMHPGWCRTAGLDGLFEAHPTYKIGFESWRTAAEGADTVLWLLAGHGPPAGGTRASFLFDREPASEHQWLARTRSDQKERRTLWDLCNRLTADAIEQR